MEKLFAVSEASESLGVSRQTLWRLVPRFNRD
jgi:predicted DNA-binding protein (UPF0251 family)